MFITVIILFVTFMQGSYKHTPETNRFSRIYSVAAVLYLQVVLYIMLFFPRTIIIIIKLLTNRLYVHYNFLYSRNIPNCYEQISLGHSMHYII